MGLVIVVIVRRQGLVGRERGRGFSVGFLKTVQSPGVRVKSELGIAGCFHTSEHKPG